MIEESLSVWVKFDEVKNSNEWKDRRANEGMKFHLKFEGQRYRIYNPDLFGMFLYFEGTNNYALDYKEGFIEGQKTLKEDEEITLTSLRDPHLKEQTEKDLQKILFSRSFKNANKGLLHKVRFMTPLVWSHDSIKYLGFCNGFMQSIEELISRTDFLLEDLIPTKKIEIYLDNEARTKAIIEEVFENAHRDGWKHAFNNEDEYKNYVSILVNFFTNTAQKLPSHTFYLKMNTKTNVAQSLRSIHKELGQKELINDVEFFNIIRLLNHFKDVKDEKLYKTLTK